MTIPAIGHVTALTWVLEVGEVERFHSLKQVISYCGLCSGEKTLRARPGIRRFSLDFTYHGCTKCRASSVV
jgi:transposase